MTRRPCPVGDGECGYPDDTCGDDYCRREHVSMSKYGSMFCRFNDEQRDDETPIRSTP